MNEQVIQDLYSRAVSLGYRKSKEEFINLLHSNASVQTDNYTYVKNKGYKKSMNDFLGLVGAPATMETTVEKKSPDGTTMVSESAGFSSEFPSQQNIEIPSIEKQIEKITPDFVEKNEEFVVPQMRSQFGDLGFKFEESGATGDWMTVTAPNGNQTEISLDIDWFSPGNSNDEANRLKNFIRENSKTIPHIQQLEKQYAENKKILTTQDEVDSEIKNMNESADKFRDETNVYLNDKVSLDQEFNNLNKIKSNTPEYNIKKSELAAKKAQLDQRFLDLSKKQDEITLKSNMLKQSVGKYTMMKQEQGTWMGATADWLAEGFASMSSSAVSNTIDLLLSKYVGGVDEEELSKQVTDNLATGNIDEDAKDNVAISNAYLLNKYNNASIPMPAVGQSYKDWWNSLSSDQKTSIVDKSNDQIKKDVKKNLLPAVREGNEIIWGDDDTSVEWRNLKEQGFWGGAYAGLIKSLPAMIGSNTVLGWAQRTAQMYGQTTDAIFKEMEDNPEFENISESEKQLVAMPVGIASAALESIGLRNIVANKGLMNRVILGAMGKAGATTTAKTFGELVKNEVNSMVAKGALTLTGAALAEAETGAAQQVVEYAAKDIYEMAKGKDLFQNPEFLTAEYVKDIVKAGAQEAVGGFVLGMPSAVSAAYSKKGYLGMDDKVFKAFESFANDGNLQSAFIVELKNKVATGMMTQSEAKQMLNDYRNSVALFRELPDGLDTQSKKESMNLLKERRDLERQIEGKEDALVQKQKNRISEINNELTDISNRPSASAQTTSSGTIIDGTRIQVAPPEESSNVLNNEETLTEALTNVDDQTAEGFGFIDENNDTVDVRGNENRIAQEYFDAINAENNGETLTQPQMSAKTIVEKMFGELAPPVIDASWANDLDDNTEYELNFKNKAGMPFAFESQAIENNDGTFTIKAKGRDIKQEFKNDIANSLNDNQMYTFDFNSMEEVPDEYRDKVREISAIEAQRKLFGVIPMGKNKVVRDKVYRVSISGADVKKLKLQPQRAANIKDVAKNVAKSMASLFPDMPILRFNNADEMRAHAAENFDDSVADTIIGDEGGMIINDASGKPIAILINEENADVTTLPHEAWHAILIKAFGENAALFEEFKNGIEKALRANGMLEIVNELDAFANTEEYKNSNMQAEEWLVQLGGLLTASGITQDQLTPQSKKLLTQIKAVFNAIAMRITGQPMFLEDATPDDVLEFMVAISDRMARGMDITEFFRENQPTSGAGTGVSSKTQRLSPKQKLVEQAQLKTNYFLPNMMGGVDVLTPENYAAMLQEFIDTGAIENVSRYSTKELTESQFPLEESNGVNPMSLRDADAAKFELEGVRESIDKNKSKVKKQVVGESAKLLPEGLSIIDGWYSPIEKRLKETKVDKQSANKWLTGGLIGKGDEAIYTGVKGWLEGMNPQSQVTKDQILNWLDNNRVEIVEVEKTAAEPSQEKVNRLKEVEDRISEIEGNARNKARNEEGRIKEDDYIKMLVRDDEYYSLEKERSSLLKEFSGSKDNTKYRAYQLPGDRKNYKEVLVTLPQNKSEVERLQDLVIQANDLGEFDRANEIEKRIDKLKGNEFYSSHFNEANIAVHLRMNTRTDSDGNRVLFLEEVQSDWGQQGKKIGFVSKEISDKLNDLREKYGKSKAEFYRIENELDEQYDKKKKPGESRKDLRSRDSEFNKLAYEYLPVESRMFEDQKALDEFQVQYRDLVPSGPFVSNTNAWVKLGLKIALREAEKQGVDYIAWTTGEQQNERYDLSKQVDKINIEGVEDNVQLVDIKLPDGSTEYLEVENGIIRDGSNEGQRLDNVIGKEYAEKVISTPANEYRVLEGEDLKMGGSGMKGFYDKIVPDVFKSLMKEITGASTEIETVNINGNQQQAVAVTPEAKAQVKTGIAKFQRPTGAALLEVQKIGQRYNINEKGFMPKQVNQFALAKEIERFGLGAKRSKVTPEGYGGSVYMTDAAGKFYNPMKVKKHRVNLSGGRLSPNVNTIEGYDRMMEQVQTIIDKSERRGVANDKIMSNVMEYVTKSKVYERANDSQREQLVRNIETEFGKKQKSAPSVGKILGTLKDITKITLPEKELLKQHFRDLAKGARDAKRAFMQASDDLSMVIKEMEKSGKISMKQLTDVIRKFSKVNMLNEDSVNGFVDYMTKVFADATYAEKIAGIRNKIAKAKKNLKSKIGVADSVANDIRRVLAVNPTLIPDDVFDRYIQIVDALSASQAVLNLKEITELSQDLKDILQSLDDQISKSEELAIRFDDFEDKVVDEDSGKIQYADTVNKMEKDGIVTAEEAELMKKYKSVIFPKEQKEQKSESEIKAENTALINNITNTPVDVNRLDLKDERELADNLRRLLKPELLKQLTTEQLTNLIRLIGNINNGYMPHYGELAFERLNAIKNSTPVGESTLNADPLSITKIYNNLKSKFTKKGGISEMVRSGGFFFIDQVFGNFKTKPIFNALFEKISEAQSAFTSALGQVNKKLDAAHDAVAKSFKYDANKTLESSFRMMAYMIQLEYESNPGSKQVNPASAYIKETIKAIKKGSTKYGDNEIEMLQRILDENGNVDKDALYSSFNNAEKNAIKTIREINDSLTEKAVFTAAVIRGQRIDALNNYVHLPVMSEYNPDELSVATKIMDQYNTALNPSTKGKNLIERTAGAKAINFDVFASAQRGAKFTLLDYHMTSPIRTARKTLNEVEKRYGDDFTKQQREIFNAIRDGFEESVSNVLTNNFIANSTADEIVNLLAKQGYRAVLGSAFRFISELSSNLAFVTFAGRKAFAQGVKYFPIISSPDAVSIMDNVRSKQTTRLYHGDTLSGRFVDQSVLSQTSGVKSTTAKGVIANKANQIYNMSLKKYKNSVELIADTLISTPDRVIMRPVWFGQFATEFKKQTGQDVDFKKIADGNESYMRQYKDAIEASKLRADEMSVLAGATDNPFMGMVKGSSKPNQSALLRAFNLFNTYMTRFAMYEYTTARQGIYAAMGNGSISRKEGIGLLAAVTARMTVYTLMTNMFAGGLAGLLGDEDEEDDKSLMQKLGQAFASTATSLVLGRNFGNATKTLVNYGVEEVNEEFLQDLRNGDYDPYKDAISFSAIPKEKKVGDVNIADFIGNMSGPFSPAMKTANLIIKKAFADEKKEPEAIKRSEQENMIRIPLEVLGNLGMIPLYKDVRREVMNELYKDLRNADKKAEDKKQAEKEMLHGYENKEDMKRYDPELYDKVFGKDSPGYDAKEAKRKLKHEMDVIERRKKDEFYDYVPEKKSKNKSGFGSEEMGSKGFGKSKGFESEKMGSKGFGE